MEFNVLPVIMGFPEHLHANKICLLDQSNDLYLFLFDGVLLDIQAKSFQASWGLKVGNCQRSHPVDMKTRTMRS